MLLILCLLGDLHPPRGIAVGPDGNIYVVDYIVGRVLIVSPNGRIRTMPGTARLSSGLEEGLLHAPHVLAVDARGSVYVANDADYKILRITGGGDPVHFAGAGRPGHDDGPLREATFTDLQGGMDIDNLGNLYVTDEDRIRKLGFDGQVTTVATGFSALHGGDLEAAPDGTLYVADPGSGLWKIAGGIKTELPSVGRPCAVTVAADGTVYTIDFDSKCVYRGTEKFAGPFKEPSGIAADRRGGLLYVIDDADRSTRTRKNQDDLAPRILRILPDGRVETLIDEGGPWKPQRTYSPEVSGSKLPKIIGASIMALSLLAVGGFLWRNRKRMAT